MPHIVQIYLADEGDMARRWYWTAQRERAVLLFAQGKRIPEVARDIQADQSTVWRWLQETEFQFRLDQFQRVREARPELVIQVEKTLTKVKRLEEATRRHDKLNQIIKERSEDPDLQDVPGGKTGLLTREVKVIGQGRAQQVVFEFSIDAILLAELRALEVQVAKELGEWAERREISGPGGGPVQSVSLTADLTRLSDEELQALDMITSKLALPAPEVTDAE